MKLENDGAIVSVSELEEYCCGFIPGELLNAVQRKHPSVTQPQGKRPSIAPDVKPPESHSWFGLHSEEAVDWLLDDRYRGRYPTFLGLVKLRPMLRQDVTYLAALVGGCHHLLWRGMMAPHIVGAEVIQLPIPSYGVKSRLGSDDGSMLRSVPDSEHALTGVAEDRTRPRTQWSLDMFHERLEKVEYHSGL